MTDEKVLFEGRIPYKAFLFSHGLVWLLLLGWNIGLLIAWVEQLNWYLKITSQRVVVTRGAISQKEEEVEYYRIQDTNFEQGSIQRLFGIGKITLISDDPTAPTLAFPIHDPQGYREQIRDHIRTERHRMLSIQVD